MGSSLEERLGNTALRKHVLFSLHYAFKVPFS